MAKKSKRKKLQADQRLLELARLTGGANANGGLLSGLDKLLPSGKSERFLLGLLIGAGAAYLFSDEELRGKVIKSALKLYAGMAGEFEEIKEQIADFKAEFDAQQQAET
jgi:hypothetical protein